MQAKTFHAYPVCLIIKTVRNDIIDRKYNKPAG